MPGHRRLCEGRDFELARFPGHRGGCAIDAGDQSERLGGGANRPGRNASGGRRRMHPAAWHRDQISWRLLARTDAKSGGRGIFPWADPDVADQFPAPRKATSLSDGKTGDWTGSGLSGRSDVVRRIAGDVADLTRAGESDDHAVLPRLELSLPVAWLDTHGRRRLGQPLEKNFRLPDSIRQAGLRLGFLALAPSAPKFFAFGRVPCGACPLPASRGLFGSVSSFRPLRTSQSVASPRTCWFKPTGQGARLRFRFRLSSVNTTVACPVM